MALSLYRYAREYFGRLPSVLLVMGVVMMVSCQSEQVPAPVAEDIALKDGTPERLWGTHTMESFDERPAENEIIWYVGRHVIVPAMFPEATWQILEVTVAADDPDRYHLLCHTANQPKEAAKILDVLVVDPGFEVIFPEEDGQRLRCVFRRTGDLPDNMRAWLTE